MSFFEDRDMKLSLFLVLQFLFEVVHVFRILSKLVYMCTMQIWLLKHLYMYVRKMHVCSVCQNLVGGGVCIIPKKKKNSHRFRAYETFGELGEQWGVLHWVISKNSISIFWMQWQLTQMIFYHIFDIHDVRNSWAYWKMATNFQFHNIKF